MPLDDKIQLTPVMAPLNYLRPMAEKPVAYNYPPPPGVPQRTGVYEPVIVPVHDARPIAAELSLDVQGVAFQPHRTAVTDFYDATSVKAVYYPEMERLVKQVMGAARV